MPAPTPSTIVLLALLPLVAWRIYIRFRRMVGRQQLSRVRPWITLAIFSIVLVLLAYAARAHVERLGWLAAGLTAGGLLAAYGLRLTRFECKLPQRLGLPLSRLHVPYIRAEVLRHHHMAMARRRRHSALEPPFVDLPRDPKYTST